MTSLHISPTLDLPVDAATETFGILAKKGSGKSNAAVVMAEEFWDAGVPWVAIDPKGDWWGVRSSADGKAPGLALPVFGGKHGEQTGYKRSSRNTYLQRLRARELVTTHAGEAAATDLLFDPAE